MFSPLMRYFVEVAREGSVRGASDKLHIAASAINRHIIEYEEELGTQLFERLPRGMRLTQAGELLFATAKKLQRDYAFALSEVGQLMQAKRGHASLATLTVFAEDVIPPVAKALLAEFPHINYTFLLRSSVDAARLVSEDGVDMALAYDPPLGLPIRILKSARIPFGVVMSSTHELVQKKILKLSDCLDYPLILQRFGEMRDKINRLSADLKVPLQPAVQTESAAMFREMVLNGTGIGFVSLSAVQYELSRGEIIFRTISDQPDAYSNLCLYVKERRELPVAAKLLADRIMENYPTTEIDYLLHTARYIRSVK